MWNTFDGDECLDQGLSLIFWTCDQVEGVRGIFGNEKKRDFFNLMERV